MTGIPPFRRSVPLVDRRPVRRHSAAWVPAILSVAIATVAACGRAGPTAPAGPAVDGLLVAAGGPLRITDPEGALAAVDSPPDPIVAVTASAGVVVAIDGSGRARISGGPGANRGWRPLELPDPGAALHLAAIGPGGAALAVAAGEPQGSFTLAVLRLADGTARSIAVDRGLNGPPAWLGPGTVAIDVIAADGGATLVTIELASGLVTDRPGPATTVTASDDGAVLALDEATSGDVLVADTAGWLAGRLDAMARLHGPPGSGVDGLAMSADGRRLAIARRTDGGGSIELLVRRGDGWTSLRTLALPGDGPISVAWRG